MVRAKAIVYGWEVHIACAPECILRTTSSLRSLDTFSFSVKKALHFELLLQKTNFVPCYQFMSTEILKNWCPSFLFVLLINRTKHQPFLILSRIQVSSRICNGLKRQRRFMSFSQVMGSCIAGLVKGLLKKLWTMLMLVCFLYPSSSWSLRSLLYVFCSIFCLAFTM